MMAARGGAPPAMLRPVTRGLVATSADKKVAVCRSGVSPPPTIADPLSAPMQMVTSPQQAPSQPQPPFSLNLYLSPTSRPAPPRRNDTTVLTSPR